MSEPTDDLAAVVAGLRAALEHAALRGASGEAPDAPLPDPVHPVAETAPVPAAPPAAEGPPAPAAGGGAWASLAREARASAEEASEVGVQGLRRIREDLGDCRRCGLCAGRTKIVFGVGDAEADLVVIGEAPGFNEDRRGEPFVGPAGEMLDRMLENVLGLARSEVYIANIVKCRPQENRNPLPDEVEACLPFLRRQIRALRPRLMLVLGSVALRSLFGPREGITRARGIWKEYDGIPVMPTFHPAYLLRRPEDKRKVFDDLLALKARYDALHGRRLR